MTEQEAIHITRNPYGHSEGVVREARLKVCDRLERWKKAYDELHQWAKENGADHTIYYGDE